MKNKKCARIGACFVSICIQSFLLEITDKQIARKKIPSLFFTVLLFGEVAMMLINRNNGPISRSFAEKNKHDQYKILPIRFRLQQQHVIHNVWNSLS